MKKRVIIIGAGWSGIYMLKHAVEAGLEPVLLEARDHPLGVWHYSKLPGGVLRKTHANSSKVFMQPSDFPFPEEAALFPHHDVIENHLLNYIKEFDLAPHIKYKQNVTKVVKENDTWIVHSGEEKREADFVVVATGLNSVPEIPDDPMYKNFSGKTLHTHYFKESLKQVLKGKNVLIVGGGETACDIANILCDDSKVYLSIRDGQWFQDRIAGAQEATDTFYNRLVHSNPITMSYAVSLFKREAEFWWGAGGSGVDIWQPGVGYFSGYYNKSRDIVQKIAQGQIYPRASVEKIDGSKILFEKNDAWENMDFILFGTGYNFEKGLSFLSRNIIEEPKFKHVFYPDDPSIVFVGYVRPYVGSVPMLAELQSRYIASVFSGTAKLPSGGDMKKEVQKDIKRQKKMFPKDSVRMPFLVNPFSYSDDVAKRFGAKPNMLKLLVTNPLLWSRLLLQSWSPFQYRVNDGIDQKRQLALLEIEKLQHDPTSIKLRRKVFTVTFGAFFILTTTFLSIYALIEIW